VGQQRFEATDHLVGQMLWIDSQANRDVELSSKFRDLGLRQKLARFFQRYRLGAIDLRRRVSIFLPSPFAFLLGSSPLVETSIPQRFRGSRDGSHRGFNMVVFKSGSFVVAISAAVAGDTCRP